MNMPLRSCVCLCSIILLVCLNMVGCTRQASEETVESASPPNTVENHAHPTEGPHHGGLIELGNEEYHGELVHDDASGTVVIYILDSAAKTAVPIDANELTINLSHEGKAEQFALAANPDAGDPQGKASRFQSTDPELAEELDHDHAEAQLVVTINGKQYRGAVHHDHDHEGHDHH